MKYLRKIHMSLLLLSVIILMMSQTVFAEDVEEPLYYYTVRLSAGNQNVGKFTKNADTEGIKVVRDGIGNPEGTRVELKGDQIVVTGLRYNDEVYIYPEIAAETTNEKYSVRGVRRSGRDNSESVQSTGRIACDMDYVISYRVNGDTAEYFVYYQDEEGNPLLDRDKSYGNIGEEQIVSARYIEGYLPQAYNLSKTIVEDETKNVFIFQYTPVETGETVTEETTGTTTTTTTTTTTGAGAAGAGAAGADAGAGAAGADAGAAADADAGVGGDATVVPDEEVPLDEGPDDIVDLDDEEVPLSDMNQERPGKVMSYLPVYIGIGVAAAVALVATALYLRKRRRVPAKEIVEQIRSDENKQP